MHKRVFYIIFLFLASAMAMSCGDPGLGVSGTISTEQAVNTEEYTTLEIRVFPDSSDTWSPDDTIPPVEPGFSQSHALADISVPYSYTVMSIGTVPKKRFRIVAWLTNDATPTTPSPGDWWGTTTFSFDSCGIYGGYCGYPSGKDLVIDQQEPYPVR